MKQDKQIKEYAKKLLQISKDGETLSEEKVEAVLKSLEANPPRHYQAVLKAYLKLAEQDVARSTALVDYAGELSQAGLDAIQSNLSSEYGRSISVITREEPSLIAGVRVRVDCDVYESSIASSLASLESSL
ncbi:F0F1 ATP synthase subunit delta [Puniceicoccaceae bacterium K14]|nr:F0F1 ATP synthase subunit delta [Puniceicoccaceae bacterium K14]